MDKKHYYIYKFLVKFITVVLLSIKVGFLYISYIISNILNIKGFISILLIVIIWTCFNSLMNYILETTIKNNSNNIIE